MDLALAVRRAVAGHEKNDRFCKIGRKRAIASHLKTNGCWKWLYVLYASK